MSDHSKLPGHLIRRMHQFSTKVFLTRVREAGYDLTPVQFAALEALRREGDLDQARLADAIAKDRATTGAVVDRLAQKRLIGRSADPNDRRSRIVSLTPEGETVIAAMTPVVEALQKEVLSGLDATEYRTFIALASKVIAASVSRNDT
ncbi:MarR family transcriptional regulator [Mesobaculum littorinae]|uniref:MarR family transcriptional regulator n=1 Tax=Mesobaculum littorinae TaxID=2486419 RepID=A0A438AG15_9RHOB|nr:MarR family transcriptional regulator [Mesobaculum littorinae]RVV97642.1 MarR family transcriptional regulator [Mesobaculum littorinae]